MNKTIQFTIFSVILLSTMLFLSSNVLAATTLVSPTAINYSSTMTLNCTTAINSSSTSYNVTFFYNKSGGATGTKLITITNTSADQNTFTSVNYNIASLDDTNTYNFTCYADNGTNQQYSAGTSRITIDDTDSVISISTDVSRNYQTKPVILTWSCTDAVSGVTSTTIALTAVGDLGCEIAGTTSWSTATGTQTLSTTQTQCAGPYTATITCTDYSGNSDSDTATFNIYYPEGGSANLGTGSSTITTTKSQSQTYLQKIKVFFDDIINFFKNLFS